ncbi:hypothetical protein [Actinomadura litoris]|uniref:hypothetical protein n=1 Tax=Actinomadura litoris TaxID=2678616 RepID=UPI001FA767C5|nr:hypothetical protein [Actinomadura litoris]
MRLTPALVSLLTAATLSVTAPAAEAAPPPPPPTDIARSHLDGLTVSPEGSMDGYSRNKFPH